MPAFHTLGVAELVTLVRRREVSPVEIVQACLAHSEALDPTIQAWVTLDSQAAMAAAKRCEAALHRGDDVGPLAGVPVGLTYYLYGRRTHCCWLQSVR
jgi:Asp-tRNA(Asn)/Glu-tRNA(Gln) amidotransferase A subunit family amidase